MTIHLLETFGAVGACACTEEQRRALRRQADIVVRESEEGLPDVEDRADVDRQYHRAMLLIRGEST